VVLVRSAQTRPSSRTPIKRVLSILPAVISPLPRYTGDELVGKAPEGRTPQVPRVNGGEEGG
jgi:hypothetical protein